MLTQKLPLLRAITLLALALPVSGCGTKAYEARLDESKKYFSFLEKQNVNLTKEWKNYGVQLRVPVHFQEVRRPPPPKPDKDGNVAPYPDPRQPAFIEGGLPGLVGAWTAKYPVEGGEAPGYFYVLSNHDLWLEESTLSEAPNFDANAVNAVMGGLKVGLPPEDQWKTENYPSSPTDYNVQRAFSAATVTPEINGRKYEATVYRVKNRDMQVILLNLMPEGVRNPGRTSAAVPFAERMGLALETFSMAAGKPTKAKATGKSGAQSF